MEDKELKDRACLICDKPLRKLTKNNDWENRAYHITCWSTMIKDIKHFDKICYVKYDYKNLIDGKTKEEWAESEEPITVYFD